MEIATVVLKGVEFLEDCEDVYDIEVENAHNFYAGSPGSVKLIRVHNCAMDVVSTFAVAMQQLEAAKAQRVYDWNAGKYVSFGPTFKRHLYAQMGPSVHAISTMTQHGSYADREYLEGLLKPDSILQGALTEERAKLRLLPSAIKVNKQLLKTAGVPSGGLFGTKSDPWILKLSKPAHRQALFIDELKLEPLAYTASGAPQIDKAFNEVYKEEYEEVAILSEISELSKLLSTNVRGWLKKMAESVDSIADNRFRSSFYFFTIVSGRLGSRDPNHQNIPSRGRRAKIVKRVFRVPKGFIQIRADYSAHEIRMWALAAQDMALIESFLEGLRLRQKLIQASAEGRPPIFEELKKKGDVHIQNVFRVFAMWVDKAHILRDTIKGIAFGAVYGLGLLAMAASLRLNKIKAAMQDKERLEEKLKAGDLSPAEAKDLSSQIKKMNREVEKLKASDPKEFKDEAETVLNKMWEAFPAGKVYLDGVAEQVTHTGFVNSRSGRRRSMFRVLTGNQGMISAAQRSAKNSPIQGISSELGLKAAYKTLCEFDRVRVERNLGRKFPYYTRMVHDANYWEVRYDQVIPFLWVYQHTSTFGMANDYNKVYDMPFQVPPEIEIEMSASEDISRKWDWTLFGLRKCLESVIDDQIVLGVLVEDDRAEVLDEMLAPARDPEMMEYLQRNYPLLGVNKLPEHVIEELIHV